MCGCSQVALHAVTSLDFSRTNRANLLPLATGLLHFAMSAPVDLIHYQARIGAMPSYNTIYAYLEKLAEEEAHFIREHANNPCTARVIWADNVQGYHLLRDTRLGRQSQLISGIAATYVEGVDFEVDAFDLARKRELLAENKRAHLTIEQLFDFIDREHEDVVGTLHFLRTLVEHIPELAQYKAKVSELFRTRASKQQVPLHKSRVRSMASSGKKETILTELKQAILDFLKQAGQTREAHLLRLILIGGDGLTYEQLLLLKNFLGFELGNAIDSLDIIEPILALWHTGWTEACRIFETHWGPFLNRDESTLGHSAGKMGKKTPTNLSKVDYKEGMEILSTVLDARILDCFR